MVVRGSLSDFLRRFVYGGGEITQIKYYRSFSRGRRGAIREVQRVSPDFTWMEVSYLGYTMPVYLTSFEDVEISMEPFPTRKIVRKHFPGNSITLKLRNTRRGQ